MSASIRLARPDELPAILAIDDDATLHYRTAGLVIDLSPAHPFVRAEQARWAAALARGEVLVAEVDARPVGFAAMGRVDDVAYLDQLSVERASMGRGVGSALLARCLARAAAPVVLTTYGHLPWNAPYYARRGFVLVQERDWGPEVRAIVRAQREALPAPTRRVVMRHPGQQPS